jgi:RNA polymerase sigma factor (sigma-70 family)
MALGPDEVGQIVAATWRVESARIVAAVMRLVRDLGQAEDIAQEAFIAALEHWPRDGIPERPGAWLMTTAKHRALDRLRLAAIHARKHEEIGHDLDAQQARVVPDFVDALDAARQDDIGDDLLRLVFIACHPVLGLEARTALTLRLLGGLSTAEIARAYLVPEPTIAQRIVRAKRTLEKAAVPFELPPAPARAERLEAVLEVVYLVFNEGHAATEGEAWTRPDLCQDALRLGRLLAGLSPDQPEVAGLLALMELQAARLPARTDAEGRPVLLPDQDRSRWDGLLIRRGLAALDHAMQTASPQRPVGPYTLQAAIAACHARAPSFAATDWAQIVRLYDALLVMQPSPVVALNRAVAVGQAEGPTAALPLAAALAADPALSTYPWAHAVHADLLARTGQAEAARAAFERAAALTRNAADRDLLRRRQTSSGESAD